MKTNRKKTLKNVEAPMGYKQTPMGAIPIEWTLSRLEQVVQSFRLGGNYESSEENDGLPLIKMGNIQRGYVTIDELQYLPSSATHLAEDILKEGDLLFNTRNTIELVGKVAVWRCELPLALYNSNLLRIDFDTEQVYSTYFMNYVFNSNYIRSQLKAFATGTTSVAAIYSRDLRKLRFALPPLPEQQKIAAILTTWDEAIEKTQKLIARLKQRNKGLAQQLLTGKKRLKRFGGEWRSVAFEEIAKRITRRNGELNDTVVTISAHRGFVLQEDFFSKRVASEALAYYYLIHNGEFAYNRSYSNGYPMGAIKRLDRFEKAVVTTLYICFSLRRTVNTDFMMHYFEAGLMNRGLMKIAQEGGRAHGLLNISLSDFFTLNICIPELSEQQAIAQVLSLAVTELKLYEQQLATLQQQKKGLMQKLLTGEVRVKTE